MSLYDKIDAHIGKKYIPPVSIIKTSEEGEALLHEFEGLELKAYLCPANVWTIGYGNTRYEDGSPVRKGEWISRERAISLFRNILKKFERSVLSAVEVPLTQSQFDALVSFTYNVGKNAFRRSTLLRLLNSGDYEGAADQFLRWNKGGGRVLAGLTRRREAERKLFLTGEWK
jgi:lysozyme